MQKNLTASDLTKSALKELSYRGFEVWRNNNVRAVAGRTFTGKKGIGDIIGFNKRTGIFLTAEVKAGKDKLSQEQADFLLSVQKAGGIALVIHETSNGLQLTSISDYLTEHLLRLFK